jgi:hypothetical protein
VFGAAIEARRCEGWDCFPYKHQFGTDSCRIRHVKGRA